MERVMGFCAPGEYDGKGSDVAVPAIVAPPTR
jgi:hypothetical protein